MSGLTSMMKQYLEIKKQYSDTIIFFRLGDFYEMFFEDAKIASKELELTLTGKDCGLEERAPMCGVPYHSCEGYIAKLVSKGYKVAICEQTENPSEAKGLVKREVVRVITQGTIMESSMLDEGSNNYICCIFASIKHCGVSFCDISTGKMFSTELENKNNLQNLKNELVRYNPREILFCGDASKFFFIKSFITDKLSASFEMIGNENAVNLNADLKDFFPDISADAPINSRKFARASVYMLMQYLKRTQISGLERISLPELYENTGFMILDYNARRNLELTETMRKRERKGTLLWVLDKTKTSMGKRMLKSWLEKPLVSSGMIINRQASVAELAEDNMLLTNVRDSLSGILDMERIMTKIVYGTANARDLRALCETLKCIPYLKEIVSSTRSRLLREYYLKLDDLKDICELIENTINEDPPFSVREGNIIKKGCNSELDELRTIMEDSAGVLAQIEERERKKTGIPKLKVGYNRVFGYFLEVSNSYKMLVPQDYIRKQTLASCERFITEELKGIEGKILGAKDKSFDIEYGIFDQIRNRVAKQLERVEKTAEAVACIDVLANFAFVSVENRYTRPEITVDGNIMLKESRHPVVERLLKDVPFVPNDVVLDCDNNRVAIITGPNMAGKSTYMRQIALIVIMAQIGCFVPAASAKIGIVDAVYTRVGASDDLSTGQSTFMVEMNEVADILKNATSKSLLILDEIGRGTSTYDGMSIARAVLEYVAEKKTLGAKTLFATHYHELTELENTLDGVKNYNIAVKKRGDDITFLRRIVAGGADQSYGIEVARLAGLPESVIKRAKEVLLEIESNPQGKTVVVKSKEDNIQMSLLDMGNSEILDKLKSIDVNTLTPIESMNILFELVKMTQ